jgi:hypothetical protein
MLADFAISSTLFQAYLTYIIADVLVSRFQPDVLQILLFLERRMNGTLVERIDWIAGTSCGGFFGLLIGSG